MIKVPRPFHDIVELTIDRSTALVNKMGYINGMGLGKKEDGIREALGVSAMKTNKKVVIFSSSITRGITRNGMNKQLKNHEAYFNRFKGKKIHDIKKYIPLHVREDKPDSVVIIAGGNDIPPELSTLPNLKIVEDLMEAALTCKSDGVPNVYISSILPRSSALFQASRKKINDILKDECREIGIGFIDNENIIVKDHVCDDGIHLNKGGSSALCRNIFHCLNRES